MRGRYSVDYKHIGALRVRVLALTNDNCSLIVKCRNEDYQNIDLATILDETSRCGKRIAGMDPNHRRDPLAFAGRS